MQLREWGRVFLKHQDMLKREIKSIDEEGNVLNLRKAAGDEEWRIVDLLEGTEGSLDAGKKQGIITLNRKENLKYLLLHWESFSSHPTLKVIFTNPRLNQRWTIIPSLHAKIADKASLKTGLEAMFSSVPEV